VSQSGAVLRELPPEAAFSPERQPASRSNASTATAIPATGIKFLTREIMNATGQDSLKRTGDGDISLRSLRFVDRPSADLDLAPRPLDPVKAP